MVSATAAAEWSEQQTAVWSVVEQSWVDDAEETGEWPTSFAADGYSKINWTGTS